MKILWVTNTIFPEISNKLGGKKAISGGWMYALAIELSKIPNIELVIVTIHNKEEVYYQNLSNITYYLLPSKNGKLKYDVYLEKQWEKVITKEIPDIIHIHGTEYAHGMPLLNTYPKLNYVVSIQGLISVISKYYDGGISKNNIFNKISFRDIILNQSFFNAKRNLKKRASIEKKYIKKTKHIIGRTEWDKAHIKSINSNINYHFCNEILRDSFYSSIKWDIKKVQKKTIFLSQANYPLKGAHKVIKSLALIIKDFPETKLNIAGTKSPFRKNSSSIKETGYNKYLKWLINKYQLKENINFLGPLNEKQMIEQYLNCNVFVCPSSIENSPNSLGEAQILGAPCIASYVGGIPDMIKHNINGFLYRYEEIEMLSYYISCIFKNNDLATTFSIKGIEEAEKRHNKNSNLTKLIDIYNNIAK